MNIIDDYFNREGDFKYMNIFELETQVRAINRFIKKHNYSQNVHPWQLEKLKMWQDIQDRVEKEGLTVGRVFREGVEIEN